MSDQILNYLTGTVDSSMSIAPPLNESDAAQAAEFLGNLSNLTVYPQSITAVRQSIVFLGKREGTKYVGVLSLPNKVGMHIIGEVSEINRALSKVKEPLRSCLVLKQQGLSYREIAESLSLNETSIGTYVARARAEFMRFYGKVGKDSL